MGQMLIHDLDDVVIARLEARAAENHTSAEEEARRTLTDDAGFDFEAWRAEARRLREELGPLGGPSTTEMLRAGRRGDHLP